MSSPQYNVPTIVDICERGAAILVCGSRFGKGSITRLRVNPEILSIGSPVFEAIFRPQTMRERGEPKRPLAAPEEYDFGDEDPMALEVICSIMHLQHERLGPGYWLPRNVLRIARASVKFESRIAVRPTVQSWLNIKYRTRDLSVESIHELFTAAYLIGDVATFARFGRDLVLCSKRSVDITSIAEENQELDDILLLLEQQRSDVQRRIIAFVERQILARSQMRFEGEEARFYKCTPECTWVEAMTVAHLQQLDNKDLYPSSKIYDKTLDYIIRCMGTIVFQERSNFSGCRSRSCIALSAQPRSSSIEDYKQFAEAIAAEVTGPCLQCFIEEDRVELRGCKKHPKAAIFTANGSR